MHKSLTAFAQGSEPPPHDRHGRIATIDVHQ
jgi:hypothetical protein